MREEPPNPTLLSLRGQKVEQLLRERGLSEREFWEELKERGIQIGHETLRTWLRANPPKIRDKALAARMWEVSASILGASADYLIDDNLPLKAPKDDESLINGRMVFPSDGILGTFVIPIPELDILLPRWPPLPANERWDFEQPSDDQSELVPNIFGRRSPRAPERIVAPVSGTSMEPKLYEGDLVVIELDRTPRTGRIVLARSDRGMTLKVLDRDKHNRYRLKSINPSHGEAEAEGWQLEGFLVGIIRQYKTDRGIVEWDFGGIGP